MSVESLIYCNVEQIKAHVNYICSSYQPIVNKTKLLLFIINISKVLYQHSLITLPKLLKVFHGNVWPTYSIN